MTADPQHRLPPHHHIRKLEFEYDCNSPSSVECAAEALRLDARIQAEFEKILNTPDSVAIRKASLDA